MVTAGVDGGGAAGKRCIRTTIRPCGGASRPWSSCGWSEGVGITALDYTIHGGRGKGEGETRPGPVVAGRSRLFLLFARSARYNIFFSSFYPFFSSNSSLFIALKRLYIIYKCIYTYTLYNIIYYLRVIVLILSIIIYINLFIRFFLFVIIFCTRCMYLVDCIHSAGGELINSLCTRSFNVVL